MIKINDEVLGKINKSEFWFDISALSLLWLVVLILPENLLHYQGISLIDILKIVALISSLELIGFFAHLFLGERSGILLQGFLGGFVSSTMTFVRFTQNTLESQMHPMAVVRALLLSTLGMLIECILIVFAIIPERALMLSLPFMTQALALILIVLFFSINQKSPKAQSLDRQIYIDEPIVWKKVGSFALIILGLIYLMRILGQVLHLPFIWTTLLLSLFEAHGVLTAALTEVKESSLSDIYQIIIVVLVGNILSKTFLVMKGKNKEIRSIVILSLLISFFFALAVIYI